MKTPAEIDPFLQHTYARTPLVLERGEGCTVWDTAGRPYLDFVAGIATCALGHAHSAIRATLHEQAGRLMHVSNLYYTPQLGALAQWLTSHSCATRAFFCNSGAEANEGALKLARRFARLKRPHDEPVIISAQQGFHGRTFGALTATAQPKYQHGFEPLLPGFEYVPFNDAMALEECVRLRSNATKGRALAGILLEPLQGEGGVLPGTKEFFATARRLCDEHDALLIFDEVQCGMGRTGTMWGYEQLGILPDVFTSAKGLGGGFPIGAMLANERAAVFKPGEHASTFGGNPLACAVALTVCTTVGSKPFLDGVKARGERLQASLTELVERFPDHLEGSRGWGLMQGLVLRESSKLTAANIVLGALENGLLLVGAGPKVVRFVPPLIVGNEEILRACEILKGVFAR